MSATSDNHCLNCEVQTMIIRCSFEQVPFLCAGLVKQGVTFTCYESSDGLWLITLMGGY